jgi:hypothetical protein
MNFEIVGIALVIESNSTFKLFKAIQLFSLVKMIVNQVTRERKHPAEIVRQNESWL